MHTALVRFVTGWQSQDKKAGVESQRDNSMGEHIYLVTKEMKQ